MANRFGRAISGFFGPPANILDYLGRKEALERELDYGQQVRESDFRNQAVRDIVTGFAAPMMMQTERAAQQISLADIERQWQQELQATRIAAQERMHGEDVRLAEEKLGLLGRQVDIMAAEEVRQKRLDDLKAQAIENSMALNNYVGTFKDKLSPTAYNALQSKASIIQAGLTANAELGMYDPGEFDRQFGTLQSSAESLVRVKPIVDQYGGKEQIPDALLNKARERFKAGDHEWFTALQFSDKFLYGQVSNYINDLPDEQGITLRQHINNTLADLPRALGLPEGSDVSDKVDSVSSRIMDYARTTINAMFPPWGKEEQITGQEKPLKAVLKD